MLEMYVDFNTGFTIYLSNKTEKKYINNIID